MRIFGIGFNKTGSMSLTRAMGILGWKAIHYQGLQQRVDRLLAGDPHAFEPDTCFIDSPLYRHWRTLRECYPDSKFILTTRDREQWVQSRIVHVLENRVRGIRSWSEIDTVDWCYRWDRHHEDVRRALAGSEELLELNIPGGDGWPELCGFLGVPEPSVPFPHINTGQERLRAILRRYRTDGCASRKAAP